MTLTGVAVGEEVEPRRRLLVPLLAACLGVLVAVVGVGVVRSPAASTQPAPSPSLPPALAAPAPVLATASPSVPIGIIDAGTELAPTPTPAAPAVIDVADVVPGRPLDSEGLRGPKAPGSKLRPPLRPSSSPSPSASASPVAVSESRPDADAETASEQGYLTLDTVPWTTVYLGKRKLGETPLVRVPVPAGSLELSLINVDDGVKESYLARVKPGEVFRTRLDLR